MSKPFKCFCEFKAELDRKGSDEFHRYYGGFPEDWDLEFIGVCSFECEQDRKKYQVEEIK